MTKIQSIRISCAQGRTSIEFDHAAARNKYPVQREAITMHSLDRLDLVIRSLDARFLTYLYPNYVTIIITNLPPT